MTIRRDFRPHLPATQSTNGPLVSGLRTAVNNEQQQPVPNMLAVVDNESFAMSWLKASFDAVASTGGPQSSLPSLNISEIYANYVRHCCSHGKRQVLGAAGFSQMIRRTFPSTNISQTNVEGIIPKTAPTVVLVSSPQKQPPQTPLALMTSPILKAHLSAPPRGSSPTPSQTGTAPVAISGTSTQANTTPTSTLIKSLLANKLANKSGPVTIAPKVTADASPARSTPSPSKIIKIESNEASSQVRPAQFISSAMTNTPTTLLTTVPSVGSTTNHSIVSPTKINAETVKPTSSNCSNAVSTVVITSGPQNSIITSLAPQTVQYSVCNSQPVLISTQAGAGGFNPASGQQQFILVRTILPGGQQGQGPVRLILPSSVLMQQRPLPPGVNLNGAGTLQNNSMPIQNNSIPANQSASVSVTSSTNTGSNDILLKAVLGSGIAENSTTVETGPVVTSHVNMPIASGISRSPNVNSSPLLNVLLDKGKNENPAPNQIVNNHSGSVMNQTILTHQTGSPQKMYILTTKQGVPIKTVSNVQPAPPTHNQIHHGGDGQIQLIPAKNGLASNPSSCNTTTQVTNNKGIPAPVNSNISVNCVPVMSSGPLLTNGEVNPPNKSCVGTESPKGTKRTNCVLNNDLSPIKDIQKAVGDAPKLITKRANNDDGKSTTTTIVINSSSQKKVKVVNSVVESKVVKSHVPEVNIVKITPGGPIMNGEVTVSTTVKPNTVVNEAACSATPSISAAVVSSERISASPVKVSPDHQSLSPLKTSPSCIVVSSTITSTCSISTSTTCSTQTSTTNIEYLCEWDGCKRFVLLIFWLSKLTTCYLQNLRKGITSFQTCP